jgi:hypothetical protein
MIVQCAQGVEVDMDIDHTTISHTTISHTTISGGAFVARAGACCICDEGVDECVGTELIHGAGLTVVFEGLCVTVQPSHDRCGLVGWEVQGVEVCRTLRGRFDHDPSLIETMDVPGLCLVWLDLHP